jgi:NTE family protein
MERPEVGLRGNFRRRRVFSHMQEIVLPNNFEVSLVLGGGNALGAYHLGVCERLFADGLEPSWCLGASIGAVTAAILIGNSAEERLDKLAAFWRQAAQLSPFSAMDLPEEARARYNNDYALGALMFGRPGLFQSRFPGLWSLLPGMPPDLALRDHRPLAATLERLIDFERLNGSSTRLSILSLDLESGDEVWFDNRGGHITPQHLLATTALSPLFAPVEIDGRLLCDAGFGNNLPFDRAFREGLARDQLCIGVDLYCAAHGRPQTLDETVVRVQDLAFSIQSRRAVTAVARERALLRRVDPASPSAILAHLAYRAPGHQRSLKPLDFSERSITERRRQGWFDAETMLPRIAAAPRDEPLVYIPPAGAPKQAHDAT